MIAKRIVREKAASDFERLGAYVLNARSGVDPASWSRLGAYVLDEAHQGEKVAWARVTNCQSDDPGWAVKEILATQARNTRSQADKSYHLVVSFPEGERPTRAARRYRGQAMRGARFRGAPASLGSAPEYRQLAHAHCDQ
jgi:MobA/VirD2-like, nuclease domain